MTEFLPLSLILFYCRFSDKNPPQALPCVPLEGHEQALPHLHLLVAAESAHPSPRPVCAVLTRSNMPRRHPGFRNHVMALLQAGPPILRMGLPPRPVLLACETLHGMNAAACDPAAAASLFERVRRHQLASAQGR
jgi:hypothetical protein